ncbi:hypothetical protein B5807_09141 [Epicoccum nigrum]|uniref:Uncharacterized protein n=1 Tax=Epicoccum nigrum TaxID=105696 RepID=A0A1Y2LMJ3_EPING|nr:hypothetical protein B5807_09141 [Epicoccum nigrum]
MFDTGETLQDVKKWAEATFPHEFKAVKDYLRDYDITSSYQGPMNPKHRNLKATDAHIFGHCVHFKKHFEGACRVISGRLEEQTRQKAAAPATFPTPSAGSSLTSELLPATQNQKKPDDMEEFLTSQKASIEEFVKKSQAADRQEKDRLLAETNELKQKLTKAEQECKESRNELDASREKFKRNAQKSKKELQDVKAEVKRLTGEVETFKKEAEKSTQEAKKAKRSLKDFQELEEVFERVQKRRVV